ncbi:MAG: serine hydrolase domain-containing protein [Myxococcota bacterium]
MHLKPLIPICLMACSSPSPDRTPSDTGPDAPVCGPAHVWADEAVPEDFISAFETELERLGADGVSFAILLDGEIRYAGGVGFRDAERQLPMTAATRLRGGSTLKMQTAAALLSMESDGMLTRDDALSDHLPDFTMQRSPGAEQTTIHQLLTHQGGWVDYTPIEGLSEDSDLRDHAFGFFGENMYQMAPQGSFYNYSNPNFSLAGLIAEQVSGQSYPELMQERVWDPLCMDRTTFSADDVLADDDYAIGISAGRRITPDAYDNTFSRPAGFAWTTTLDMLHFAHFLLEGETAVMSDVLRDEMVARQVSTLSWPETTVSYGYGMMVLEGVFVDQYRPIEVWNHGGALFGFSADLYIVPSQGLAVATLSNSDGAYFGNTVATILDALIDLPDGVSYPGDRLEELVLTDYVGEWVDPNNVGVLNFSVEDGALVVNAPTLDELDIPYDRAMVPFADDRFIWTVQGTAFDVTFLEDPETGALKWMRNRAFVARKSQQSLTASHPSPSREAVEAALARGRQQVPHLGHPLHQAQ